MYRDKEYRARDLKEVLADIDAASAVAGDRIAKVFVADGDALVLPLSHWRTMLEALTESFPNLRRISCYATAPNLQLKSAAELSELRGLGLSRVYIGPESGDDDTLKRIAKGATYADHVEAAQKAHDAGIEMSVIALLGVAGKERSQAHAEATAALVTAMDPAFFAALTTTIVPGTPLERLAKRGRFELPDQAGLLTELKTMISLAKPSDAMFRTNHASNYLALAGRIPRDSAQIVRVIEGALAGDFALRPEWSRGL